MLEEFEIIETMTWNGFKNLNHKHCIENMISDSKSNVSGELSFIMSKFEKCANNKLVY